MTPEHVAYFDQLAKLIDCAQHVPFRKVELGGWQPRLNECHANVDYWVSQNPSSLAVRGWLFWRPGNSEQYMFMAHSIAEESEDLVDITPLDSNTLRSGLLFLRHTGSEDEFNAMKPLCSQVFYRPPLFHLHNEIHSEGLDEDSED